MNRFAELKGGDVSASSEEEREGVGAGEVANGGPEGFGVEEEGVDRAGAGDVAPEEGVGGEGVRGGDPGEDQTGVAEGAGGGEGGEGEDAGSHEGVAEGAGGEGVGVNLLEVAHGGAGEEVAEDGELRGQLGGGKPWEVLRGSLGSRGRSRQRKGEQSGHATALMAVRDDKINGFGF